MPLQKNIETLEEYLAKLKEYTQKIYICGDRNSYSKTDTDATFMCMKEDAMGNGQLKTAYNVQRKIWGCAPIFYIVKATAPFLHRGGQIL